jgi:hypothetical protein
MPSIRALPANAQDELVSKVAQTLAHVSDKYVYLDTIHLLIPSVPSSSNLAAITQSNAGAVFPVKISNPVRVPVGRGLLFRQFCACLRVQRPTTECLRRIASLIPQHLVTRMDLALDLIADDVTAAAAVKKFIDAHLTQPWRGKRSCAWVAASTYWGKASTRRNIMVYHDRPSKIRGSPACHVEFRFCRARVCRNYGVSTVLDLLQLDPCAVMRRNCRLSVIDHRKLDKQLDQEAGKMLLRHNRSSGTLKSNRLLMRRRLESMLAHALSIPIFSPNMNVSDLCAQQLIDKAPTIAKSCVVSISPEALLQGVVALPPLFTACVGPDIRRDHVVICNADET